MTVLEAADFLRHQSARAWPGYIAGPSHRSESPWRLGPAVERYIQIILGRLWHQIGPQLLGIPPPHYHKASVPRHGNAYPRLKG